MGWKKAKTISFPTPRPWSIAEGWRTGAVKALEDRATQGCDP